MRDPQSAARRFWVVGDRLVDAGIAPVRAGAEPVARLVPAEEVDLAALTLVADRAGVAMVGAVGAARRSRR